MTFLIILDGAEENVPNMNEYSPPAGAEMLQLKDLAAHGISGNAEFYLPDREVDSLTCILTMLGVPAGDIPLTRAPVEALGAGVAIAPGDTVCRCNLVSVKDGKLDSFNGGTLSRAQMMAFAAEAAHFTPAGLRLFHLSDYRNLLVAEKDCFELSPDAPPPHESVGMPVEQLMVGFKNNRRLSQFIEKSKCILPGYILYPWGSSQNVELPSYKSLTGHSAACVCGTEVVAGIGKALGMTVCTLSSATGDSDTDLAAKAKTALRLADSHDTVILHINGTDELAHRRDLERKKRFLEYVDSELIGRIMCSLSRNTRILVTSDHVTSSETGRHKKLPVRWVCSDYYASRSLFMPPQIDKKREDKLLFDYLLKEELK